MRLSFGIPENTNPSREFILDSSYFPMEVVQNLMNRDIAQDQSIIDKLNFKNNICHECQGILPKYRYCHDMYGTKFKQNYGWYINKQFFEYGIKPVSYSILTDSCPEEILDLLESHSIKEKEFKIEKLRDRKRAIQRKTNERNQKESSKESQDFDWNFTEYPDEYYEIQDKIRDLKSEISKHFREIEKTIENEVRAKLDHYKVGEKWTSETILYHLIDTEYQDFNVERHARPDFLDGLELDIYIPEEEVGVEYQGKQHYKPVEHWGGEEGLEKRQERDKKKKQLCKQHGVELVYFRYDENLSEEMVQERLGSHIG